MRRSRVSIRMGSGRLGARERLLRRNQKVDVVKIVNFGRVHRSSVRWIQAMSEAER